MAVSAGQRTSGVAVDSENREKNDFYPTPPYATRALLDREKFDGDIWEPACGDGAISDVLKAAGYHVQSTDLVDRGYGVPRVDFLMEFKTQAPNIVTNPPYKFACDFARKALELASKKVAMLMRLQFLESKERRQLFSKYPPTKVWVFSERLSIQRGRQSNDNDATGTICFIWIVWDKSRNGPTEIDWI